MKEVSGGNGGSRSRYLVCILEGGRQTPLGGRQDSRIKKKIKI